MGRSSFLWPCVRRQARLVVAFAVSVFLSLSVQGMLGPHSVYAQEDDYEEWKKQQQEKYNEYLNEQDKAFLKFLKKEWKNVDVEAQTGSPITDKPREIPTVSGLDADPGASNPMQPEEERVSEKQRPDRTPVRATPDPPEPPTSTADEVEEVEKEVEDERDRGERAGRQRDAPTMSTASLSFYGTDTSIPYSSSFVPSVDGAPGKKSIRTFWRSMAGQDYSPALDAIQETRDELALSDWGYYIYLRDLADRLYREKGLSDGSNAAVLWTWFMMMKSGYSVRVGFRGQDIFLLLPVDAQIFNRPQMYLDDQRYYLMVEDSRGGSLRTYEGQHESADGVLEFDGRVLPKIEGPGQKRTASFSYGEKRYNIEYTYDSAILEYLSAYPNVELGVLFRSRVSSQAESSLRKSFDPHLTDQSSRDALNILLRFSQFVTDYERDQENFGEERFLFPEETLAASASDCEDRAVLFAYLARTLLDRTLVGLEWPNHVATAVKVGDGLSATEEDRTVTVDGETYIMADPTYIGSSVGMEMPIVEGKKPEIIRF